MKNGARFPRTFRAHASNGPRTGWHICTQFDGDDTATHLTKELSWLSHSISTSWKAPTRFLFAHSRTLFSSSPHSCLEQRSGDETGCVQLHAMNSRIGPEHASAIAPSDVSSLDAILEGTCLCKCDSWVLGARRTEGTQQPLWNNTLPTQQPPVSTPNPCGSA
eukprot:CAMPEP_0180275776 /NCGR_PEP_ID=MMETSP0988-20121125/6018_1 /TAXON_ID=697907 /ORGANISM="non described non described, Strain CCMP2293" /LENGTH=162 /DNA_ID=CAMNT_0022247055 /DNA_START=135 /DNA_END=621 /DNA_ORIENTATION=+